MLEAISGAVKVLFEKRFIPTVVGIVVGILVYAVVPETNSLLIKLGRNWFVVLIGGTAILLVSLIQYIVNEFPHWKYNKSRSRENADYLKEKEREELHNLWDIVDNLSVEEREIVDLFLRNGNKPIVLSQINQMYCGSVGNLRFNNLIKQRTIRDSKGFPSQQYVLDADFYNNLLYSKIHYGKISNFEECAADE